ncbi:cutinase family protein [Nocardia asteroides]
MTRPARTATGIAALILGAAAVAAAPAGVAGAIPLDGCPALYILGVQGTGQSSPTADPLADTGVVGSLIGPVVSAVPGLVQRAYLGYSAGFGGIVPGGGADPYVDSVSGARAALDAAASEIVASCPNTKLAAVGYSQGAQAVSDFARAVGAGDGPVPAERVAGVALYANPDRSEMAPVFPGRPGQTVPDPAPGTSGAAVSGVRILAAPAGGAGIATTSDGYGALTGRVTDICSDGDLACSAPPDATLLRLGAQLFAHADLTNPFASVATIGSTLSEALGDAWNTIVLDDFQVSGTRVSYDPQMSLGERVVDAADPRSDPADGGAAAARWNEITAALAAAPWQLPGLLAQLGGAWGQLVAGNADLVNPMVWVRFADTVGRHNGYASTGQLASGTAWMIALAHDCAEAAS